MLTRLEVNSSLPVLGAQAGPGRWGGVGTGLLRVLRQKVSSLNSGPLPPLRSGARGPAPGRWGGVGTGLLRVLRQKVSSLNSGPFPFRGFFANPFPPFPFLPPPGDPVDGDGHTRHTPAATQRESRTGKGRVASQRWGHTPRDPNWLLFVGTPPVAVGSSGSWPQLSFQRAPTTGGGGPYTMLWAPPPLGC